MTIDIKELDEVKKVNKPWGYEKWIADGKPNFKYVLKEILFKSNFKSSIQFHEFKVMYRQLAGSTVIFLPQANTTCLPGVGGVEVDSVEPRYRTFSFLSIVLFCVSCRLKYSSL